ncbi:MAG: MOSC domain-containing protein [Maricaulaceae bacterium]
MKLHSLHIYPVKSSRGVELTQSILKPRGLEFDRRWMLVDGQGQFISQRTHPKLAQLRVTPKSHGLIIDLGKTELSVLIPQADRIDVSVWKSSLCAPVADKQTNSVLSEWLGTDVRLVYMDEATHRPTSAEWAPSHETSFSDGYPVLVTNTASLAAVNDYIAAHGHAPISMARFRPNVVIETDKPWAEDDWKCLQIGEAELELVKPCTRCTVTTLDPQTGEARPEPVIEALRKFRMSTDPRNKGVLFGVNAVVRKGGALRVGMTPHLA